MASISEIEGIGPATAEKLGGLGIHTTEALLQTGASPQGRRRIAQQAGTPEPMVLDWVNRADLFRVPGIGSEYSDLLEEAGVDTVVELSRRDPEHLFKKVMETNEKRNLVRRTPTETQVADWVEEAKHLPPMIMH
jgi:predicted flap endonuclease-1-like 5' DNA nuclease